MPTEFTETAKTKAIIYHITDYTTTNKIVIWTKNKPNEDAEYILVNEETIALPKCMKEITERYKKQNKEIFFLCENEEEYEKWTERRKNESNKQNVKNPVTVRKNV